jgi:hypothetical protein
MIQGLQITLDPGVEHLWNRVFQVLMLIDVDALGSDFHRAMGCELEHWHEVMVTSHKVGWVMCGDDPATICLIPEWIRQVTTLLQEG